MISIYSPNMLKTFKQCQRKFYFKYVKNISMPVNDSFFEFGKNIHALASYYLRKENIDKLESSLTEKELSVWNYLKQIKYFSYELIATEYNLAVKIGDYFFGGRIDALLRNGEEYYILDYKTGSLPQNSKYDFQTMIYMLAVSKFFKTSKVNFVYIDLKNNDEIKIPYNGTVANEYEQILLEIANKINNSELPDKTKTCTCEYSSICF